MREDIDDLIDRGGFGQMFVEARFLRLQAVVPLSISGQRYNQRPTRFKKVAFGPDRPRDLIAIEAGQPMSRKMT
jgi:hypothetical protein